jgi:hypothetical protein
MQNTTIKDTTIANTQTKQPAKTNTTTKGKVSMFPKLYSVCMVTGTPTVFNDVLFLNLASQMLG